MTGRFGFLSDLHGFESGNEVENSKEGLKQEESHLFKSHKQEFCFFSWRRKYSFDPIIWSVLGYGSILTVCLCIIIIRRHSHWVLLFLCLSLGYDFISGVIKYSTLDYFMLCFLSLFLNWGLTGLFKQITRNINTKCFNFIFPSSVSCGILSLLMRKTWTHLIISLRI